MRDLIRFGLGLVLLGVLSGFAARPVTPPSPLPATPAVPPAVTAPAPHELMGSLVTQILETLPAPQAVTPSLTTETRDTLRALATNA